MPYSADLFTNCFAVQSGIFIYSELPMVYNFGRKKKLNPIRAVFHSTIKHSVRNSLLADRETYTVAYRGDIIFKFVQYLHSSDSKKIKHR